MHAAPNVPSVLFVGRYGAGQAQHGNRWGRRTHRGPWATRPKSRGRGEGTCIFWPDRGTWWRVRVGEGDRRGRGVPRPSGRRLRRRPDRRPAPRACRAAAGRCTVPDARPAPPPAGSTSAQAAHPTSDGHGRRPQRAGPAARTAEAPEDGDRPADANGPRAAAGERRPYAHEHPDTRQQPQPHCHRHAEPGAHAQPRTCEPDRDCDARSLSVAAHPRTRAQRRASQTASSRPVSPTRIRSGRSGTTRTTWGPVQLPTRKPTLTASAAAQCTGPTNT